MSCHEHSVFLSGGLFVLFCRFIFLLGYIYTPFSLLQLLGLAISSANVPPKAHNVGIHAQEPAPFSDMHFRHLP